MTNANTDREASGEVIDDGSDGNDEAAVRIVDEDIDGSRSA